MKYACSGSTFLKRLVRCPVHWRACSLVYVLSDHQWLQFDVGPPKLVAGVVTKGRGDKKQWVTRYRLSYSNDSLQWHFYSDNDHLNVVAVCLTSRALIPVVKVRGTRGGGGAEPPSLLADYTTLLLSTRRCRTSFDATRKSAYAVDRQWTVRRTTNVLVGWYQSSLRCRSTIVQSAAYISPSNGLYARR